MVDEKVKEKEKEKEQLKEAIKKIQTEELRTLLMDRVSITNKN